MRALLLLLILCAPIWACSCVGYPSAKDAWLGSPLVFVGFVEKTDPTMTQRVMAGEQTAWVRVTESFKGVKNHQLLELQDQFSSCFGGFREGTEMLFYLHPGQKPDVWRMPACYRSASLQYASDDLKFLRGLPTSALGNRVSGVVGLWEDDPVKGFNQTQQLGGVKVRAVGASGSYETMTDAQGLYEFRDLRPGKYTIKVDYPPGTTLRFPIPYGMSKLRRDSARPGSDNTSLEVTETSGNGFDFVLSPDTRVTGRVLGPGDLPLKDVCVEIEPLTGNSSRGARTSSCTKKDGSYELREMSAGSYRIVANSRGQMTAAAPFGRIYYPGTSELDKAKIVTIAAGKHLQEIDIHVAELAQRIELRGRLMFSNSVPLTEEWLEFRSNDGKTLQRAVTDTSGNFEMQILAGRPGVLTGQISVWRGEEGACPQFHASLNPKGFAVFLKSTSYAIAGDQSLSGIDVVFSFPSCDAWLEKKAERK